MTSKEAKIKDGTSGYFLHFDHKKTYRDSLGYIVSNQEIRKALYQKLKKISNIKLFINKKFEIELKTVIQFTKHREITLVQHHFI